MSELQSLFFSRLVNSANLQSAPGKFVHFDNRSANSHGTKGDWKFPGNPSINLLMIGW
jgi:hypothetical protein